MSTKSTEKYTGTCRKCTCCYKQTMIKEQSSLHKNTDLADVEQNGYGSIAIL